MKFWLCVATVSVMAAPLSAQSAADLTRWSRDVARSAATPRAPLPAHGGGCAPSVAGGTAAEPGIQIFSNSWRSAGFTTFRHVIEGPPGRVNLVLDACTSASGGETVALYRVGPGGVRKPPRILFVIATLRGNARSGSVVLPRAPRGQRISRLPVMVVVENASGRPHSGSYRLMVRR